MLHTKHRGNRPTGSGEDFLMVLPYMSVATTLVMWPRCRQQLSFSLPKEAPHKIWLNQESGFRKKKMFKIVDSDDGRTDAAEWVYYRLTYEPSERHSKQ